MSSRRHLFPQQQSIDNRRWAAQFEFNNEVRRELPRLKEEMAKNANQILGLTIKVDRAPTPVVLLQNQDGEAPAAAAQNMEAQASCATP